MMAHMRINLSINHELINHIMCRYVSIGHYQSNTLLQPSFSGAEPGLCSIAAGSAGNGRIVYIGDRNPEQGTCQVSQVISAL